MALKIVYRALFVSILVSTNVLIVRAQTPNFTLLDSYSAVQIGFMATNAGIPSALLANDYGVDLYKVVYTTTHPNGETIEVSGALCLPQELPCALPLAVYCHGTVLDRENVPSRQNYEGTLGIITASTGFGVLMPDYIGLGDSQLRHLYLHADSEAQTCIDMVDAVLESTEELEITWNTQLFTYGYSQGGHAAAALQRKIETDPNSPYTVTASAPMSGPYDLAGVQTQPILDGQTYSSPAYLPYVILSFQEVYGNLYTDISEAIKPAYLNTIETFYTGEFAIGQVNALLPNTAQELCNEDWLQAVIENPEHPLRVALEANTILDWAPIAPTILFFCDQDEQVYYQNSLVALNAYEALGSTSAQASNGGNFDHGQCVGPSLLGAYVTFYDLIDDLANLEISIQTAVYGPGFYAEATLNSPQDLEDYTVIWQNEDGIVDPTTLSPGEHSVTITSPSGCSHTYDFFVEMWFSVEEIAASKFNITPNPSHGSFSLLGTFSGQEQLTISTLQGKIVYTGKIQAHEPFLDLELSAGVYLAHIAGRPTERLIVEK